MEECKRKPFVEVCEKYKQIPKLIILKTDIQRRGIRFSEKLIKEINPQIYQVKQRSFSREAVGNIPVSFMLRDGTSVIVRNTLKRNGMEMPYQVDVEDGKFIVRDGEWVEEEIFFWEKPDYYDKKTENGIPMWKIASARPQRLDINPYQYCDFWKKASGCKFCEIASTFLKNKEQKPMYVDASDIFETVKEALKEKGRYTSIFLTGGSICGGEEPFDEEVDLYIDILKRVGELFKTRRFPSQLIGTAYTKKQLSRLYENTGLMSYTADIEVLNRELFQWICPGKSQYIGYDVWKERLYQAVEIFGKGYVNTGIVAGVELAKPKGFRAEDEALSSTLKEAEELMKNGVSVVSCIWRIAGGSVFADQSPPSLEYYVRLIYELDKMKRKYGFNSGMDDYRRCGNHPDTDLARIWSGK